MTNKLITNPLKKRRLILGLTQTEVASQLGITQSQYSRLEKSQSDSTKYLLRLSKIFECEPEDLLNASILPHKKKDFLSLPNPNEIGLIFHEDKPNEIFLDLKKGWHKVTDIENLLISIKKFRAAISTKQPKPIIRPKKRDTL